MTDLRDFTHDRLKALISSPAIKSFDAAMGEADSPLAIYMELRRGRKILNSDELERSHKDIIEVTKSAVVLSFSALDALVHAVLRRDLPCDSFSKLRYKTFQSSSQIESALKHLSSTDGFTSIASHISFDLYTEERVRKDLDDFYDRKNYITHHADIDENGNKLSFSPEYAHSCTRFVRAFGHAFHIITFRI